MHIEGHASNENSGRFFGAWRHLAAELPGGGMTGAGIHVLDAFIRLMGPVQSVSAQLVSRKSPPDPNDMLSAMFRFASGATGLFSTLRSTPSYRRVHVFGPAGSAEALGDTELVIRRSGQPLQQLRFAPVDSLRAELSRSRPAPCSFGSRRGSAAGAGRLASASRLGAAISPPVVVAIVATLGWRSVFYICAAVGILWAACGI